MTWPGGECLACARVAVCTETSVERVLTSYLCPLFEPVPEPIYTARAHMLSQYGRVAVEAILDRPMQKAEGEE